MPRSSFNYNQSGIGVCGHVVWTWPQTCELGGRNPEVVCEECTRDKYGLDITDVLLVVVRLKPEPKTVPVKAKKEPKPKKLTPWQTLMQEEGLF